MRCDLYACIEPGPHGGSCGLEGGVRGGRRHRTPLGLSGGDGPRCSQSDDLTGICLVDLRHVAHGLARRPNVAGVVLALGQVERRLRHILVGDAGEQVADRVQPRVPLDVGFDYPPGESFVSVRANMMSLARE